MKKILVFIVLALFLINIIGFIDAVSTNKYSTGLIIPDQVKAYWIGVDECSSIGNISENGIYNNNSKTWWFNLTPFNEKEGCNPACVVSLQNEKAEVNWMCTGLIIPDYENTGNETNLQNQQQTQNQEKIKSQNRIQIHNMSGECPTNCSCQGSVIQCQLRSGRQMTVSAGNSGNTIVQTKGQNISTKIELYTEDGIIYGQFKGQTKAVNLMPDQIQEKLQQKISSELSEKLEIKLDENGNYQVQTKKQARFLGMFKVQEKVRAQFDSETGEMLKLKSSWWGFLAKDVEVEPIIGASCGTVSPTGRTECCQNKGYNSWNEEKAECLFYLANEE